MKTVLLAVAVAVAHGLALGCGETRSSEAAAPQPGTAPRPDAGEIPDSGDRLDANDTDGADSGDAMAAVVPGAFCYQPLDCRHTRCKDYAPLAQVCELGDSTQNARYEGDCGSYRYRSEGPWYAGTIRYWDRETGKLVAIYSHSDSAMPCQNSVSGDRSVYEQCEVASRQEACANTDADAGPDEDAGR